MRSNNIQADIWNYISDYKVHSLNEIASAVECSKKTVYRHIQSLSYSFKIQAFKGGIDRGGVRLIPEQKVSVEKLTSDDLQLIIEHLESLLFSWLRHNRSCLQELKQGLHWN